LPAAVQSGHDPVSSEASSCLSPQDGEIEDSFLTAALGFAAPRRGLLLFSVTPVAMTIGSDESAVVGSTALFAAERRMVTNTETEISDLDGWAI
jgi:hypothetical protein